MNSRNLSSRIISKALEYGASSAGIANIEDLKKMPSFVMTPIRPHIDRVGAVENETGLPEGVVAWPKDMIGIIRPDKNWDRNALSHSLPLISSKPFLAAFCALYTFTTL